jgi:hypothetical protein
MSTSQQRALPLSFPATSGWTAMAASIQACCKLPAARRGSGSTSSGDSAPPQPSFLPAMVRAAKHPARQRREQQLQEICNAIVDEGSDHADGFFRLTAKLREMLSGVRAEASARHPAAAAAPALSSALSSATSASSATVEEERQHSRALTSLNPSVSIEEATAHPPSLPVRKRHREQQKRYTSRGERPSGRRSKGARAPDAASSVTRSDEK